MCLPASSDHQNRKPEALDLVRDRGGSRAGKQALHADLRLRHLPGPGLDLAAPLARRPLALDWRRHRIPDLCAESSVEHPSPVPIPGAAIEYPPQWAQCPAWAAGLLRPTNSGNASSCFADLASWPLVLFFLESRKALSRVRLGMGVRGNRNRRPEPADILPLACLRGVVCRRQRHPGVIVSSTAPTLDQTCLPRTPCCRRRRALSTSHSSSAARDLHCVREGAALSATRDRDA